MRATRPFFALLSLLLMLILLPVSAQDQPPPLPPTVTPTPIPIIPAVTEDTSAPSLPVTAPTITPTQIPQDAAVQPEVTAEAGADSAPDTLPPVESTCPTLVQPAFTATQQICSGINPGQVCVGNGSVSSVPNAEIESFSFAQPGDITAFTNLDELSLRTSSSPNSVWAVVNGSLQLASTDGDTVANTQTLIFGDVTISDTGQQVSGTAQSGTVLAQRGMNVRRSPQNSGVVVWQLSAAQEIIVTGRTPDLQWLRIEIPSRFGGVGWVFAPFIEVAGGDETLPFVNADSPPPQLEAPDFGPMQSFTLLSATTPETCGPDIPDSGLLLQSPSGLPDAARVRINDVELQFNGTMFVQAQANAAMRISVLEGEVAAITDANPVNATVGSRIIVQLNANLEANSAPTVTTFNIAELAALPIQLLARQFALDTEFTGEAQTQSDSSADTDTTQTEPGGGFGTPPPTATPAICTLTAVGQVRNVRSGPSTEFPVSSVLQPGERVRGIGQNSDTFNFTWYQTESGWIRFDTVDSTEACINLPQAAAPPLPQPTATPTPDASSPGLTSSELGDVCAQGSVSASRSSDGTTLALQLGGMWTANAGTTVTFSTQGGQLRPELGDFIQLNTTDGMVIARSNDGRTLSVTFTETTTFTANFSAGNGDLVVMSATCGTP